MADIDWTVVIPIVGTIGGAVVGALLHRKLERRPNLLTYFGHLSQFSIRSEGGKPFLASTHSLVVRNAGGKAATNVRIRHNVLPENFQVFPVVDYTVNELPRGVKDIVIPTLVPKQQVTVSYLYPAANITWQQVNAEVQCDEMRATVVQMLPAAQQPIWRLRTLGALVVVGAISAAYLLFMLLRRIVIVLAASP